MRRNAFGVYLLISGLSATFLNLYGTVAAVYRVRSAGLDPLQLVLVGTALEAACFVAGIPTGILADIFSRRLLVVIGFLLEGAGFALEGAIPHFETILLAQVLWGTGAMCLDGALEAWIADEVGDERLSHVFIRASQVSQLCGIVGIVGAGLLASIGYNLPLLAAGVLMFALGVVAAIVMPETNFHPAQHADEVSRTAWHAMRDTVRQSGRLVRRSPILLTLLGVAAFYGMSSEGFDRLWEAHLLLDVRLPTLGTLNPVLWFSIILIVAQLLSIGTTEVARRRVNTSSHVAVARVLFGINALLIVVVVVFGLAVSFPLAVAAYLMADVLRTTRQPIYLAWLTQTIDARVRATVLSISSQLDAFGQIAGGPVIGVIGTARSIRAALVATSITLTPALLLFARATRLKAILPTEVSGDVGDEAAAEIADTEGGEAIELHHQGAPPHQVKDAL
jgi:MFS transporter, DHA3 family, tetracycline resistance protein